MPNENKKTISGPQRVPSLMKISKENQTINQNPDAKRFWSDIDAKLTNHINMIQTMGDPYLYRTAHFMKIRARTVASKMHRLERDERGGESSKDSNSKNKRRLR